MDFLYEKERIYALDPAGKCIAEVTFPTADGKADIDHTFVDDSLRGQGVAGKLVAAAVEQIRRDGLGLVTPPSCSYAVKWFEKHADDIRDLV